MDEIAEYIYETSEVPDEAVSTAKKAFLDTIGVGLAGSSEPVADTLMEYFKKIGDSNKGNSTIIGRVRKGSLLGSALANGTFCHALDYDDISKQYGGHPSVTLIPPILAVGEHLGSDGSEALTAYVVGYEVQSRIGASVIPQHYAKGWHTTGSIGTFGATAASCKLLGCETEEIKNALGIAASMASGIRKNFGTMTKPFHAGHACSNGLKAAFLAKEGFTGSGDALFGEGGYLEISSGSYSPISMEGWTILDPGIMIKKYPCCGFIHGSIYALEKIMEEKDIQAEDVESIESHVMEGIDDVLRYNDPKNDLEAKFSVQFPLAVKIVEGRVGMEQFNRQVITDEKIKELMQKIKLFSDIEELGFKSRIVITLKDGTKLEKEVSNPKGSPENPLSEEELKQKFIACSEREDTEDILTIIDNLEDEELKKLTNALSERGEGEEDTR